MSIANHFPIDRWDFKSNSVLAQLPPEDLEKLTAHMTYQQFSKGEVIFREGSTPSGLFFIQEGRVKKYKTSREGNEQILYIAGAGELIGYHALLSEERYPDSAAALEESLISFIPKEDFFATLDTSKALSRRLLKLLSHEFTVFANNVMLFGQRSVRERLATQLIVMREKYKENFQPGMVVEINLSREDLASMVGTARENVVRALKEFKKEGALETRGRRILITDVHKLLQVVNQP